MDPYKVLGISANQVKHQSDVDKVRHRAKKLFKRFSSEKKKFEAKKVLEAFEQVKSIFKGRAGEGQYKVLGRSRRERELDKHFNRQTKEITKNKTVKRQLRVAQKGERRIHLPGDKERIPRHRQHRRSHRERRRRREEEKKRLASKPQVDVLQGLQRLAAVLPHKTKFPKVIKLLCRWMREYMNIDSREYVFQVLQGVAKCEFLTEDPDARQDVVEVFEYVLAYFSQWFDKSDTTRKFSLCWRVSTVLACRCFTDDAFTLAATIAKLNEALTVLEEHRELFDAKAISGQMRAELKAELKAEIKHEVKVKSEVMKSEVKSETNGASKRIKTEHGPAASPSSPMASPPALASPEGGSGVKDEDDDDDFFGAGAQASSDEGEGVEEEQDSDDSDSDDDDEADGTGEKIGVVDAKEEVVDLDTDAEDEGAKHEISSGSSGSDSDDDVEECESSIFPAPAVVESLDMLRAHFVDRCLATLFRNRGPMWARSKIDNFFQDVFYRRSIFRPEQQTQVEAWQARIKTLQNQSEHNVGEANNNPLESMRPVVDSRELNTIYDSDTSAWASKQTFDSREVYGGSKVIR